MGLQNAMARRLGVPGLTTTVLTLTLTGLAADSTPAGGEAPVVVLSLTLVLLAVTSVTAHRLSAADAPWLRPRP